MDASHCKVPPHAAGARWVNQAMGRTKGGTKVHLALDAHGMPVRAIATSATVSDCTALIDGQSAKHLLADKGYDSDAIIKQAIKQGTESQHKLMQPNIPLRKHCKSRDNKTRGVINYDI